MLGQEALLAFVVAGFVLAGSPGPNTLSLAAAGAAFGVRRSLAYMTGLAVGMLVVMIIVASGMVAVLLAVPGIAPVATLASVVYFVYLAWRIAMAPPLTDGAAERRAPTILGGLLLSLVNPKGYFAMLALFSGHALIRDRLFADAVLKIAVVMAIIVLVNVGWLFMGAGLARYFRHPKASRIINVAFAVLLLASAVLMFQESRLP